MWNKKYKDLIFLFNNDYNYESSENYQLLEFYNISFSPKSAFVITKNNKSFSSRYRPINNKTITYARNLSQITHNFLKK